MNVVTRRRKPSGRYMKDGVVNVKVVGSIKAGCSYMRGGHVLRIHSL